MKILIISNLFFPNEIGGYEIGCRDYTSLLNKMGHETLIATSLDGQLSIRNDKSVRRIFKMFTKCKIWYYRRCTRKSGFCYRRSIIM